MDKVACRPIFEANSYRISSIFVFERQVMFSRRSFILGLASAALAPHAAFSARHKKHFVLNPRYEPQMVPFSRQYGLGTEVVDRTGGFSIWSSAAALPAVMGWAWARQVLSGQAAR